jgi:hypothetical protein
MNNRSIPCRQQSQIYDTYSKNIETFANLSVAIVSQKYQEFSMQVENREYSYYSFNARYKKNCHSF